MNELLELLRVLVFVVLFLPSCDLVENHLDIVLRILHIVLDVDKSLNKFDHLFRTDLILLEHHIPLLN